MELSEVASVIQLERAVLGSPFALKPWLALLGYLSSPTVQVSIGRRISAHERAVAALPTSYKLWHLYSQRAAAFAASMHPDHPSRQHALAVFVRASRALPHCPAFWERAVRAHMNEKRWRAVRALVDEAISSLPVTLHSRFWRFVVRALLEEEMFLELGAHCLSRARMLNVGGDGSVELFRVLRDVGKVDEAVNVLSSALSIEGFGGDDRRDLWMELVGLVSKFPGQCSSIDVTRLVRMAIERAEADVGELWAALAGIFIRLGQFRQARAVFEEALTAVPSVRDFALVFDAYARFLETLVCEALRDEEDQSASDEDSDGVESLGVDIQDVQRDQVASVKKNTVDTGRNAGDDTKLGDGQLPSASPTTSVEELPWEMNSEALMADLEALTDKRPILLSDVCLRQNPHNVHEWHKRARYFTQSHDLGATVTAYTEAVRTVDPWRASHGRPHTLWLAFAQLYENANDLDSARRVFDKAVSDPEMFKAADDLAALWCEYAEMELRQGSPSGAQSVLERATAKPMGFDSRRFKKRASRQAKQGATVNKSAAALGVNVGGLGVSHEYDISSPAWLFWKSLRVWSLLVDLVESIGTADDVFKVHQRMLDLKIATVQTIMNGAAFLESQRLFELSFRLLDRATSVFPWHEALRIWTVYLTRFVARYGSRKVERVRDLFEQAIRQAPEVRDAKGQVSPNEHLLRLYIFYADVEERFGLPRHAMAVYSRAVRAIRKDQLASVYRLYVVRVCELFGVSRARQVYEDALEMLQKREEIMEFAQRFAGMETRLGEIDRARAIFAHTAEVAPPHAGRAYTMYWAAWNAFELEHGTEDTYRDMLRVKRRVQMMNAGVHLMTSVAAGAGTVEAAARAESERQAPGIGDSMQDNAWEADGNGQDMSAMSRLERKVRATRAMHEKEADSRRENDRTLNTEELDIDLDDDDDDDDDVAEQPNEKNEGHRECPQNVDGATNGGTESPSNFAADGVEGGARDETQSIAARARGEVEDVDSGRHQGSHSVQTRTLSPVRSKKRAERELELEEQPVPAAVANLAKGSLDGSDSPDADGGSDSKRRRVADEPASVRDKVEVRLGARERLRRARGV